MIIMYISKMALSGKGALKILEKNHYKIHQAIWDLFSDHPDRKRDFIYRRDETKEVCFLTASKRIPKDESGFWKIETKPYEPKLKNGQWLSFSLLANPVRTGRNAKGKHARFDVVMDEKLKLKEKRIPRNQWPTLGEIAYEAGKKWILQRSDKLGVEIDETSLKVDEYREITFPKKGRRIKIATLEFNGILTVIDPDMLCKALFHGVGPAKSFGCGLLLVKRF